MFKKLLLASMLVVLSTTVSAFEIKGIALGQPLPEMGVGEYADVQCSTKTYCMGMLTLAGYDVFMTVTTEENGIVKRVDLLPDSDLFLEIKDFLIKNYGNYSELEHSTFTALDNSKHEQEKLTWRSNNSFVMEFERFYISKGSSNITLQVK